jgi:hypothetical protein
MVALPGRTVMGRTHPTFRVDRLTWLSLASGIDLGDFRLIDRALVNINEDREVRYWTAIFRCSTTQLLTAIAAVGTKPEWVRAYLKRAKS